MPGASNPFRRLAIKAALVVREVSDLGPSTSAAIVSTTLRMAARDRRDRRAAGGPATSRGPGDLVSVDRLVDGGSVVGARCRFAEADLEVRFLADDLVRVTWGPGPLPPSWAVLDTSAVPDRPDNAVPDSAAPGGAVPEVSVVPDGPRWVVRTAALRVVVAADGSVRFFDPAGRPVRHELPPLRRGVSRTFRQVLRPDERVSGLGEQASSVDLRGTAHRLWNRDPGGAWGPGQDPLYCGIPVMVGLHPEGDVLGFFDNTYEADVRIAGPGSVGPTEITFAGGVLRHYVATGPLPRLLSRYAGLTGRPPLPPRWALGYHQCKWGYKDEADIREVADGFRAERLPLSAVHLDIDYMDGYRVFSVDAGRFPDLAALSRDLGGRGTRVVTIVDPAVKADPEYDVYADGVRGGHFLLDDRGDPLVGVVWPGRAVFPDFTAPATRRWWAGWYRRLLDAGVAGVWHDMNEPTSMTLWGDRTLPRGTVHAAEGQGGDHRECHNVYGLQMDRAGWEGLAAARPDRRPFVLSRAGWAGVGRWAWTWTGDVESSWDGLRQQVGTAIGLGLSGVPYTGSDIGGFSGVPSPELYLRWLELSVLMPFCRTHSVLGSPNREPWRFPPPYRGAIGRLIRFRYRLLPYLYTLADQANRFGYPLVRPLCWPAPHASGDAGASGEAGSSADPRLWAVDDAYFLGDRLLVAPATGEGGTERSVPLPAGRWYRWRALPAVPDGPGSPAVADPPGVDQVSVVDGRDTVVVDTPMGQPVVLVREGSVLVLDDGWADGDDGALTAGHEPRLPAVHCFPDGGGEAEGTGYDDAGDGYGPGRHDRFRLIPDADADDPTATAVLQWARDGDYPAPARVRVVVHGWPATRATADGRDLEVTVVRPAGGLPATMVHCGPFDRLHLFR